MNYPVTQKLEPQPFFHWFEALSQIPHGSGKEGKLAAFLMDYARERNIQAEMDAMGNILMRLPAAAGYEAVPAVLFQAHMDMVWAKEKGVDFDFETQPLRLAITGDRLHAQGTTLGADNAVGMATMLALGDARDIPHPPLEFLFTVQEEVGMQGIRAFDMQKLRARRMINMDCGDSHVLGVSSGGKLTAKIQAQCALTDVLHDAVALDVSVQGGTGGHGGLDIGKGRCCAANAAGTLVQALQALPVRLCSLDGSGSIMRACTARVVLPKALAEQAEALLQAAFETLQKRHRETDPALSLTLGRYPAPERAVSREMTQGIARMLRSLPSGVYDTDSRDASVILTSGLWGAVNLENGRLEMTYAYRATNETRLRQLFGQHTRLAEAQGLTMRQVDSYPGWQERERSPFRDLFQAHHRAMFGKPMELERVSGGIEVGIITTAIADMDAVGIAPTSRGAHTPGEYLLISQVKDYWQLLTAVLADIP